MTKIRPEQLSSGGKKQFGLWALCQAYLLVLVVMAAALSMHSLNNVICIAVMLLIMGSGLAGFVLFCFTALAFVSICLSTDTAEHRSENILCCKRLALMSGLLVAPGLIFVAALFARSIILKGPPLYY